MLKQLKTSQHKLTQRRDFLSRSVAVGGLAVLGLSAGPARALAKAAGGDPGNSARSYRSVRPGNATLTDFNGLVGQRFRLQTEAGNSVHARLIEANAPPTRRAPRFRREHFSLIFDVPGGAELYQGHYRLSHPQVGSLALFMVPVDLPAKHNRLEAVFA